MLERINSSMCIVLCVGFILGFFANLWILRSGFLISLIEQDPTPESTIPVMPFDERTETLPQVTVTVYRELPPAKLPSLAVQPIQQPSAPPREKEESPQYCFRKYKYLLLSTQRSGTHYVASSLNLHPRFTMGQEIFKATNAPEFRRHYNVSGLRFENFTRNELVPMITELVYGFGNNHKRHSELKYFDRLRVQDGFILHNNQAIMTSELLPLLSDSHNWKAIHLVRENVFQVYVSLLILKITGEAHCSSGVECKAHSVTVKLDPKMTIHGLQSHEQKIASNRQMLAEYKIPHIEVTYEGLLNGTESFCDIWKFTECSCAPILPTGIVKSVNRPYSEIIENFAEVKAAIMKTQYAKYVQNLE